MSGDTTSSDRNQALRRRYHAALHQFTASDKTFEVLSTVAIGKDDFARANTLYVLDSSFNPPTRAHLRIARSALLSNHHHDLSKVRLLLLLATQNADKPSKPASFEDRLVMMSLFAQDLQDAISSDVAHVAPDASSVRPPTSETKNDDKLHCSTRTVPPIDIGVTKLPYFIDKAVAISTSERYPSGMEQVQLTGYDTLIRIFDTKYYPPEHTLTPLAPFLKQHRLRVTLRPDDEWGGGEEQRKFLADLAGGTMEDIGGKREWAERIEIVDGRSKEEEAVSSTKAREVAGTGDTEALERLVTDRVRDWVALEGLYKD